MNICNYLSSFALPLCSRYYNKKIDQTLFRQIPRDILHIILSYHGDIVYRHGMYMNRISKNDPRLQLYRPMIHTVADTPSPYFVFYTSTVYFEKRIPYIMDHLRNRGWTLFLAGVNELYNNDTKSFQLKVYMSHYKNGINPTSIVTSFIVSIHTRNGYSSEIDEIIHYG